MKGISVSKGVAIGKAYRLDATKFCIIKYHILEADVEKEVARFHQAIEKTKPPYISKRSDMIRNIKLKQLKSYLKKQDDKKKKAASKD